MRVAAGLAVGEGGGFVVQQGGRGGHGQVRVGQGFVPRQHFVQVCVEVGGVDAALDHARMAHEFFQEIDVRLRTHHLAVGQRFAQAGQRARAVQVPGDELGDHRVVEDGHRVAFHHARVQAHVRGRFGQAQGVEPARAGQEVLRRVLGVQAHFNGVAVAAHLVLAQGQRLACGDAQLPFHQVQAGHQFGHRVLHLQAGVDFHEVEIAVRADDELHRAGVDVVNGVRGLHRGGTHARAQFGREEGRGRFLHHLLVAALRRAFALVEVDDVAVAVAEHLHFDVARLADVALDQHAVAAEGAGRFALARLQRRGEAGAVVHDAHALAAAAVRGLDHLRVADAVGFALQVRRVLVFAGVAGHHGHAAFGHQLLGAGLAAHLAHGRGPGPDEHQARGFDGFGEVGVLGEEAVARVDGLGTGLLRHLKDGVAAQVAVLRPRPADRPGFVGQAGVAGADVGLRVNGHRADAQPAAGADDPAGDFAAVGDQYFIEHFLFGHGLTRINTD